MEDRSYFVWKIDTQNFVELSDFVGSLVGIENQFNKYLQSQRLESECDAKFLVRELRKGSLIVEIIPVLLPLLETVQHVSLIDDFLTKWSERIERYFEKGGRDETANRSDLSDVVGAVVAIANDPDGTAQLDYVSHRDGVKQTETIFKFKTADAKTAIQELEFHQIELEAVDDINHARVSMFFERASRSIAKVGKRSGERVVIEVISKEPKSLIYASQLAEEQIKDELVNADENLFKKAFIVDVNTELRNGKPWAYRVTHLHQVIPFDENED